MNNVEKIARKAMKSLLPPPKYTVSQWADARRRLSSESSAIPGRWRTSLVEYMREPMDCVGDPRVREIVIMAGAQIAKTEVILNICGYLIDYDPSPIMVVQPTLEMAEAFSKDRVAPMLRDTPCLAEKIDGGKSRDANDTIRQKKFPGGHLTLVGANSPSSLASRPIRAVLFDEVDRFPVSAGEEGDPISLARKRATTFWNRIIFLVSTPTNKGASRIETGFEGGDMRRRWCPCPDCGHHQVLRWSGVRWTEDRPETARYACEECGSLWTDVQRIEAVRLGEWRADAPFNGIASFHIPGLLSPFTMMSDAVTEFLQAKRDPAQLRVFVNTYLGETWEEDGERVDEHSLMARRESYETEIPDGVTLLTTGIDVQDDRIEAELVGWGDDFESWSIEYRTFYGDPSGNALWDEVRSFVRQIKEHPRFGQMSSRAACIDTGGHYTQNTYDFVRANERVYGIKGVPGEGKALVGRPSTNNFGKIPLFPVGVHTAKELVFARMKAKEGEVGHCHWPDHYGLRYFEGLTAEKLVTRYHKGFKRVEYIKIRSRNEPLDTRVYATAALELLAVDLVAQRKAMESRIRREAQDDAGNSDKKKAQRPRSSFVNRWRDT